MLASLFEEFIRERIYLKNITPKTERYHRLSFSSYQRLVNEPLTRGNLTQWVIRMRETGVKPVSCNTYISGINAFCTWLFENGHLSEPLKVKKLKVEQTVLQPIDETSLRAIVSFKPKTQGEWRIWSLLMLLLDTGCRIEEALSLERGKVDLENLLLTVKGKGQKERIIPFSLELRKILFKQLRQHNFPLVFCTKASYA